MADEKMGKIRMADDRSTQVGAGIIFVCVGHGKKLDERLRA